MIFSVSTRKLDVFCFSRCVCSEVVQCVKYSTMLLCFYDDFIKMYLHAMHKFDSVYYQFITDIILCSKIHQQFRQNVTYCCTTCEKVFLSCWSYRTYWGRNFPTIHFHNSYRVFMSDLFKCLLPAICLLHQL